MIEKLSNKGKKKFQIPSQYIKILFSSFILEIVISIFVLSYEEKKIIQKKYAKAKAAS